MMNNLLHCRVSIADHPWLPELKRKYMVAQCRFLMVKTTLLEYWYVIPSFIIFNSIDSSLARNTRIRFGFFQPV